MKLNAIEIILDSSISMGEHTKSGKTKLEIVKELLIKLLVDEIIPSKNRGYIINIRYFIDCHVESIDPNHIIETLDLIVADGNRPLIKAINKSVDTLNNLNENYIKKIIVLSDGEDTCGGRIRDSIRNIKQQSRKTGNIIQVYTVKIGNVSDATEKDLKYIAKETNGEIYTIDIATNMDKMYSSIKRDFSAILKDDSYKNTRKYRIITMRTVLYFIAIFLLLFLSKLSCSLTSCSLTSCSLTSCSLTSGSLTSCSRNFKANTIKAKRCSDDQHNENTTTQRKHVNGINITLYTPTSPSKKDIKAITYNYKNNKVIILQNLFSSGESEFDGVTFIKNILNNELDAKRIIKNISIIGHTDLEKIRRKIIDKNKYCSSKNITTNTNQCLGEIRSQSIKNLIIDTDCHLNTSKITVGYDNDFFLQGTNNRLGETLIKAMNISKEIQSIKEELLIPSRYDISSIRNSEKIQAAIQENINQHKENSYKIRFLPFRSVVVIVNYQ
jgi:hypothetical protein